MSETTQKFPAGTLIWAKMKGFPPWPAQVLSLDSALDIPAGRVPVLFFGTRETAFMKPGDLFAYMENRHQFEVPRKHKGFNDGVNEIRVAAGLSADSLFSTKSIVKSRSSSPVPPTRSHRSSTNSKLFADVFISGLDRKRTASTSSYKARSRTSSSASLMKSLARSRMLSTAKRTRLDSESSTGSKNNRIMLSGLDQKLVLDAFDQLSPLAGLEGGILEQEEDAKSRRSRGSSKVFEEYMLSASRHRTRSGSEGKRSRLISGVSDVFDELFEQANTVFSAEALMLAIDNLPSEGSGTERARTPEAPAEPLPAPVKFCSDCGCECHLYGVKWRCTSKFCLKWNGTHDPFASSSRGPEEPSGSRKEEEAVKPVLNPPQKTTTDPSTANGHNRIQSSYANSATQDETSSPSRIRRKPRLPSPEPPTPSPRKHHGHPRPKQYKVEETPPVGQNGMRSCIFCSGQVRPQMCGGNKHRWRCVDKHCRKWYGWVRADEEFPRDLCRKSNSQSSANSSSELVPSSSPSGGAESGARVNLRSAPSPSPPRKRVGRPPKNSTVKFKLNAKKQAELNRPKRKYTKRADREKAMKEGGGKTTQSPLQPPRRRSISPLSVKEAAYRPSAMERRARWWRNEKRKSDYSPPRPVKADSLDVAAAFRMISQACMSAAVTRADEPGTVAGTLDLLMDTVAASVGPLLSLFNTLPNVAPDKKMSETLWNASLVHTSIFQ